jgi:uncharacterized protein YndB with AHSA1/START domain
MARAYASTVIPAPIETVWAVVRDFNGLPGWAPAIAKSEIEEGLPADRVGCIRNFHTQDGTQIRERLLTLDDHHHSLRYNFEKPAFPVRNYIATMRLMPVSDLGHTFCEWEATFDEGPGDEGRYEEIISRDVFGANWASLKARFST